MKLGAIYVCYGLEDYPGALDKFLRIAASLKISSDYIIVVDNSNASPSRQEGAFFRMQANNVNREFSGWESAILNLEQLKSLTHFLLVTSAFEQMYTGYLSFVQKGLGLLNESRVLGHLDCYPEPVEIFSSKSQWWIRTCFYFLPADAARKIKFSFPGTEQLFQEIDEVPFSKNSLISENYRRYILDWLTGKGYDDKGQWHKKIDLRAPGGVQTFITKAKTIVFEHMLTIQIKKLGLEILDFEYASKCFDSYFGKAPDGIEQIRQVRPYSI